MNIKNVNSTENYLEFPDGRKLCYAEYGDPDGFPIFVFHGGANSRLLWKVIPGSPFLPNVRLIAPDRPGFGKTDFIEGVTTLENWPNDVAALADSLGIEKFAIFGPSGGGPYALACAWKIPDRLTSFGIYASVGPLLPETVENLNPTTHAMWKFAPKASKIFKLQLKLFAWLAKKYPKRYAKMIMVEFSDTDIKDYERLEVAKWIEADRNEGFRQKGVGMWYDAMLPANWPIPLNEIKTKVNLWQGEEDITIPLAMGQYMTQEIPNCEATFIKGAGHFWIFEHMAEILGELLSDTIQLKR